MEFIIIKTIEEIMIQLKDFFELYPDLYVESENTDEVRISGSFLLNREFNGHRVYKKYNITIVIPINSSKLPYVIDSNSYIDEKYRHYYSNGVLCLETDTKLLLDYEKKFDIIHWMENYVECYFFTYEYYKRYGEFPYGERSHGVMGIIETYQDILNAKDVVEAFHILQYIHSKDYRGHMKCPCQSGKRIRDCHGKQMMRFYTNDYIRSIFLNDYSTIINALKEAERNERNTKKAK